MRRIVLAVLAGVAVWGLSACERSERPGVFEPAFGRTESPPNPCPLVIGVANELDGNTSKYEIVVGLYKGIDLLFLDVRSRNGAKSHVDNIVREVCDGDYAGAQDFLHNLVQQIEGQPDDMLSPDQPHVEELVSWAQVLARPMTITLPEGVLASSGVLAVTQGDQYAPPVRTRNGRVIVNAADFKDDPGSFVIAIAPGKADYGDYVVFGTDLYDIRTDGIVGATDSVLVVFCGSDIPDNLKIAHQKGTGTGGVELLTTFSVDCDALFGVTSMLEGVPTWLRSLARYAGAAVRKVFGPTPVYARAETGLGGRTKSFSPFALVSPLATLTLSCESRVAGTTISLWLGGKAVCSDGEGGGPTVNSVQVAVGPQTVNAQAAGIKGRYDVWFSSLDLVLNPAVCPPKWQSTATAPANCTISLPEAGGSLNVKLTDY